MNCDLIAPWYYWLEYLTFGPALQRRRLAYVDEVAQARRVLILGDGDGRFLAEFLARNQVAVVDAVDSSPGMMRVAKRRIRRSNANSERVHWIEADAGTADLAGNYDLVISHFFLDCFSTEEVEELVSRVSAVACSGAGWLVSEFRLPQAGLRRVAAVLLIRLLYLGFRVLTGLKIKRLPEYAPVLEAQGFRLQKQQSTAGGLLVSELWGR